MNCKNCDAPLSDKFCANCGQKADIHRITFKHFLHEFFHAFTHTDKGILLLMKALITRPGHVAKEYLDGKRKKYFNPLSFLVILSSAYAYISYKSGYFEALTRTNQRQSRPTGIPFYRETMEVMVNNGKVVALFLMPVLMSLFSWMFFRKGRNNLAENLVLNSFMMGQIYIITIVIFIPWYVFFPEQLALNNMMFHPLMWIYMSVAYIQFFNGNKFLTTIKSLIIVFLFMIFFWLCIWGYVAVKHMILG